jgi:dTDP-4-dehydrorhamnose 3,5-epimerase-like enzyme
MHKYTTFEDNRGSLLPIEFSSLPFTPKRVFVVKNVPAGIRRGGHAHYKTRQFLICLKGEILVHLQYNKEKYEETTISENESILIPNMVWDWQEFITGDDVLMVMCSTEFDENDYIRNFEKFII